MINSIIDPSTSTKTATKKDNKGYVYFMAEAQFKHVCKQGAKIKQLYILKKRQ